MPKSLDTKAILDTSGRWCSMPNIILHLIGKYSIVTLGSSGTLVKLQAIKLSRSIMKSKELRVSVDLLLLCYAAKM